MALPAAHSVSLITVDFSFASATTSPAWTSGTVSCFLPFRKYSVPTFSFCSRVALKISLFSFNVPPHTRASVSWPTNGSLIDRHTWAASGAPSEGSTAFPAASFAGRSAGLGISRPRPAISSSSPTDCRAITAKTGMNFACATEARSPPDSSSAVRVSPPSTFSINSSLDSAAASVSRERISSLRASDADSASTTLFPSAAG